MVPRIMMPNILNDCIRQPRSIAHPKAAMGCPKGAIIIAPIIAAGEFSESPSEAISTLKKSIKANELYQSFL